MNLHPDSRTPEGAPVSKMVWPLGGPNDVQAAQGSAQSGSAVSLPPDLQTLNTPENTPRAGIADQAALPGHQVPLLPEYRARAHSRTGPQSQRIPGLAQVMRHAGGGGGQASPAARSSSRADRAERRTDQDTVEIHIGRIEVAAVTAAPLRPMAPPSPRKSPSLDEYLKRGRGSAT